MTLVVIHSKQNGMNKTQIFLDENKDMEVTIVNGASYRIADVIDDCYRAVNGQFLTPDWSDGMKKEYFDVSRVMAVNIKDGTDIDTKNIGVQGENQEGIQASGLIREVIKNHLKVEDYATLFNDVRDELVDFGHVQLEKTSEGTRTVDLRNIIRPAHILDVQKSGQVIKHEMTYFDMLKKKDEWAAGWDEIEALYEKMKATGKSTFLVYSHWCIDEFDGQTTKGCIVSLDRELLEPKEEHERAQWSPVFELARYKTPWTSVIHNEKLKQKLEKQGFLIDGEMPEYPFLDIRFVTVKGRWMGAGVYEITAPIRRAYNRTMNIKLRHDEIKTKGTFLHTKGLNGKSLTQEAINALESTGVVELQNGAKLEQLRIESLVYEFITTADKFFEFARQLLGLTAQGTGEDLPANMPATTAVINQNRANTLFDRVLEIQGNAWKVWFSKFELRDIMDNLTMKKWAKIQGNYDDIKEVLEPFVDNYLNMKLADSLPKNIPLAAQLGIKQQIPKEVLNEAKESLMQRLIKSNTAFVQLTKKIVQQADFFMEFYITNESFSKSARIQELQALRADALTNPASSLSPKKIEAEILNNIDLDMKRFEKSKEEQDLITNPLLNATLPTPTSTSVAPQAVPAS